MKALVTGGGGFLGSRIAQMLHARGDDVIVLGRRAYPHHDKAGIATIQVDLRGADAVGLACKGMDIVFHVGGVTGIWGKRKTFWDINVVGTRNVIDGCRLNGVPDLVFTSSPSVVLGEEELCGVDESIPYAESYLTDYSETKAVAEQSVLEANGSALRTVALRPHLVWGPGDPHLIPRVIARARKKRLIQVGDGLNLVDVTYIDNAAEVHLQAADALAGGGGCAGQAYFISQGEPVLLWSWFGEILAAIGAPKISRTMSYRKARRIGALLERGYRLLCISKEPQMTRFLAAQLAKSHYFDISAARRDLGYNPRVSTKQGTEQLIAWIRDFREERSPGAAAA